MKSSQRYECVREKVFLGKEYLPEEGCSIN